MILERRWTKVPFEEAVIDITGGQPKLQRREYQDSGLLPVVDQGQEAIAGYTNDENMKFKGKLPVVLFGDHTRIFKYVDFPFVMGADGVKALSPKANFDTKFLYFYFQSVQIESRGYSRHFKFLKEVNIPLFSISEQRRIVEILGQADALRKKRAEADEKSDRILPALFIKMFGDPIDNPKGLQEVELGKVIAEGPQNGLYKHASFYGEGTPILRIDSFYEGIVDTSKEFRRLKLTADEVEKYKLSKNDIVINRVNGSRELFGKSALVPEFPEVTVFESNMMKFSVDTKTVDPVYIIRHLQTPAIKQQMLNKGKHINQYSVNQGDIRSLKILLPSLSAQESFASRVTKIQNTFQSQSNNHVKLEQLFEILLHRAFSGELTAEWRKAHMNEILQEMEHQAKVLGIPHTVEYEQLALSDLP